MSDKDLVAAVREDHNNVRQLFSDLEGQSGQKKAETWTTIVRMLAVHETAEEMIVYPAVRTVDGAERFVEARLKEEDESKKVLSDLEKLDPNSDEFAKEFPKFRDKVLEHAKSEEEQILPRLEKIDDKRMLEGLAGAFAAAKAVAPTHPHKTAPESAIGNVVMGPAVAIMDRVRDVAQAAVDKVRQAS